ncbi:FAST kinase domain-containing protein 1, mitochondrial-like isoform X1 [Rhinatrema bivittatum]|uniref:FAST kinase domain-containing protein 1, mitochondrial-like isoform X1 n=1 Tax=Rhinatrema bivittatum TaxID=194408 RepID=UPI001128F84A|nr:FAST kinase domain-containing protein 1, mitochondrial-like isoform X1 [Rhinatrema bivittatum]XP_029461546.1 FAST kinase domain-containing protein 1, mitochondrial-like isoform X1 [Rhinatrema bivittatum]XP_029461547.1 FAST kinase domain-containing protein 1, mitochondrial-like isoform X1 [Rhinatrema bivittatum]
MLCLKHPYRLTLRLRRWRTMGSDSLLEQLRDCVSEEQVFQLVGKNKAKLSAKHVGCAVNVLWQFQKEKPTLLRTTDCVRSHPEFLALRILAENKIDFMDDDALVDMLYNTLRFNVEHHDSLVEQLLVEGWRRLARFDLTSLSKFAVCLTDQQMYCSPLMGKIADIVSRKLDALQDIRVLSVLMISISAVTSQRLRDRLTKKAESLIDAQDSMSFNNTRRIVQFLRNIRHSYRPLLEKCNRIFLQNCSQTDAENLSIILGLYQALQFNNSEFRLLARQRLTELIDSCDDSLSFTKLFAALGPLAGPEVRERLEADALLMADELSPQQVLVVAGTLEEMECRNLQLIEKITSLLHKFLDVYRPIELAKITQTLMVLRCQNPEIYTQLRKLLTSYLQVSVIPCDVAMLTRVLAMLPLPRVDDAVISKVDAVLAQCNLNDLNALAVSIVKWVRSDQLYRQSTSGVYGKLLQKLNHCAYQRVQKINDLDLLLEELKYVSGDWLEEILLKETMITCQRLIDQVTWTNVPEFSTFLTRTNYLCTPLLNKIASVTLQHIKKIHHSATYAIILLFMVLNYEPPQGEQLFETCIQHFRPHLTSFEPHLLVLLGYALAVGEYFPEDLIKAIFNVDFLAKLDTQLETLSAALSMRIRLRLMELNRAVCLECPQFQVPWFHDRYCQQLQRRGNGCVSTVQQQIHQMLGEILGGISYVKISVLTPYYYAVDFECILHKNKKPLLYLDQNILLTDLAKVHWGPENQPVERKGLPPGARRIAVEFLDSKAFCKNSCHLKGEYAMKKRHLEILGYHVVQIPHFEWNSMELSTKDAWIDYLKRKIFEEET